VVAEGEHLIRKELQAMEQGQPLEAQKNKNVNAVVGTEQLRQKKKARLLVGGGTQEDGAMDLD
jgi:large subunit ribosomal protein L24e